MTLYVMLLCTIVLHELDNRHDHIIELAKIIIYVREADLHHQIHQDYNQCFYDDVFVL